MKFALLLWLSWMSLLLESSCVFAGLTDFRPASDSQNLVAGDDDIFNELLLDQEEDFDEMPSSPVYTGYSKLSFAQLPNPAPEGQNVPNKLGQLLSNYFPKPSSPLMNTLTWYSQSNDIDGSSGYAAPPEEPLSQGPAGQPDPYGAGYAALPQKPPSQGPAGQPDPYGAGYAALPQKPPSQGPAGQPDPYGAGYAALPQKPPSQGPAGQPDPYGAGYAALPQKPPSEDEGGWGQDENWMSVPFSNYFGDEDFEFGDDMLFNQQNSVSYPDEYWVPKVQSPTVAKKPPSPLPQPKRIFHSKSGYKRGKIIHTKTFYSPKYDAKMLHSKSLGSLARNPLASREA